MSRLNLEKVGDNQVRLGGIDWITALCLLETPHILQQAKVGSARARLFPLPLPADDKLSKDWEQLVVPELEKLFASAGEIMAKDVAPLEDFVDPLKLRELSFPLDHCDAWMSAINQARLILGAQHNVTEKNMNEEEFAYPDDPLQQAVVRIHVLGFLLQTFVEFVQGPTASTSI